MKRSIVLILGCLVLGLGGVPGVFGQKKKMEVDVPERKEIPGLIKQLTSKSADERATAAKRLGYAGEVRARDVKDALPTLLEMAKSDTEAGCRAAAAGALGKTDPDAEKAVPILIDLLKDDKDYGVKTAAANALGSFTSSSKQAIPVLKEAQDMAKAAGKDDKEKRALGQAAGASLKRLTAAAKAG